MRPRPAAPVLPRTTPACPIWMRPEGAAPRRRVHPHPQVAVRPQRPRPRAGERGVRGQGRALLPEVEGVADDGVGLHRHLAGERLAAVGQGVGQRGRLGSSLSIVIDPIGERRRPRWGRRSGPPVWSWSLNRRSAVHSPPSGRVPVSYLPDASPRPPGPAPPSRPRATVTAVLPPPLSRAHRSSASRYVKSSARSL